ncbi:hypothetical protein K1719_017138 [Acacia pycnantha]|nr:hypothetical protein K1719_017138 [Acacia pycnantha]
MICSPNKFRGFVVLLTGVGSAENPWIQIKRLHVCHEKAKGEDSLSVTGQRIHGSKSTESSSRCSLENNYRTRFSNDVVTDIPCDTKGGIKINFEKIQVVNRLHKEYVYETLLKYGVHYNKTWIHDKIHHHINQFCISHSLQQVYIDDFVKHRRIFEQLEEERIKVLIAVERQKVAEKEAETLKKVAISEAKKMPKSARFLWSKYCWKRKVLGANKKLRTKCTYNMKSVGQMLISTGKQKRQKQTG